MSVTRLPFAWAALAACTPSRCGPPPNPERVEEGRAVWIFRTGGTPTTPALMPDGDIVVGTSRARVHRLSADGRERWKIEVGGRVAGVALSPDAETIYVGAARRDGGTVLALEAETGHERWGKATPGRVAFPVVAPDGTVVVGGGARNDPEGPAGTVWAFRPNGEERWSRSVGKQLAALRPVVAPDGTLFIALDDGTVIALDAEGEERWRSGDAGLARPVSMAPLPEGGLAVLASRQLALFTADGRVIHRQAGSYRGWIDATPDGTVLVATENGEVVGIGSNGRVRWRRNLERASGEGDDRRVKETPIDVVAAPDGGAFVVTAKRDHLTLRSLIRLAPRGRVRWRERLTGLALTLARSAVRTDGAIIVPTGHWNRKVAKVGRGEIGHQRVTCFRDEPR